MSLPITRILRIRGNAILPAACIVAFVAAPASAVVYTFNGLTPGSLDNQDNWKTQSFNTATPITVSTGLPDGTNAPRFEAAGPGYGADASRLNNGSFSIPTLTGSETDACLQADVRINCWGSPVRVGCDSDSDGIIRRDEPNDLGPGFNCAASCIDVVSIINAFGTTTIVPLTTSGVGSLGDWIRFRMLMNLSANNATLYYRNLTRGDQVYTAVSGLVNVPLFLDGSLSTARNPARWNGLYFHFEGAGSGLDNLLVDSSIGLFTVVSAGLTGVITSSVAWGDYDNDGDLDILLTGHTGSTGVSKLYRNDAGAFTDIGAGLTGVYASSVAWGDYDNDGDLDILLTGALSGFSKIYRNDAGVFTDIALGPQTGVRESSVAWGDYDNDGDLDILLTGERTSSSFVSRVYRNDSGAFTDIGAGLTGVHQSSVAWGDYDNDGDLDILLTGAASGYVSKVYRNDAGAFTDIGAGLTGVFQSSVAWGDYDNDGDLDILLTGAAPGYVSKVYRNDAGAFTDIGAGLTGVAASSVVWGDYDNDGDLDILLTGYAGTGPVSKVYRNDPGAFTDIDAGLLGVYYSSVAWGDYDNDGDLDILLTGYTDAAYAVRLFRNDAARPNTAPGAPSNLSANRNGNIVTLSWNAASDGQTPAAGLTYNVRVGTTPGGGELFSAMADAGSGFRRVPRLGNVNHRTSWSIALPNPLPATLYWGVQAVDGAWAGGPFAETIATVDVGDRSQIPTRFALRPCAPNPLSAPTRIEFELPVATPTKVQVFDIHGRRVRTLVDASMPAGAHGVTWNLADDQGRAVAPGLYLYRLIAGDFQATRRMTVLQ